MKKLLSLIMIIIILSGLLLIPAYAEGDITIISPSEVCTTDLSQIRVECSGATKIIFELDGIKIGETSGEKILPLEPGTISAGNHSLKVSAIFADKTATMKTLEFNARKHILVKSSSQDFDSYESGAHESNGINFYPQPGKYETGNTAEISPVVGKSGNSNDKALKMSMLTTKSVSSNAPYFNYKNFINYGAAGILTLKFDIKVNSDANARVRMFNMPLIGEETYLIYDGKIGGTNYSTSDDWMEFDYVIDYTESKAVMKVNGTEVYNGVIGNNAYVKNQDIQFVLRQPGGKKAEVTFDNFDFRQELVYGLKKMLYDGETGWTSCGSQRIPTGTTKLKIFLTEALDETLITKENISVYENGIKLQLADVLYNSEEKSVTTISSDGFKADSDIVVRLSDKLKLSNGNNTDVILEARTKTEVAELAPTLVEFKKNSSLLINGAQIEEGDVISTIVHLNNNSDEKKNMTAILYVRQNKRLRSIASVEAEVPAHTELPVNVVCPAVADLDNEGDVIVRLAICDTLENALPYMAYTEIK